MWEHFCLCIKEPSANLQNTNKVTGCATTPIEKPGTNSACTTLSSAVFVLECWLFGFLLSWAFFLLFFFSFYWSKFSIATSLQQNNKYGICIECFSYCKKHCCRQKQKSHGAAAILQAILDRSAALPPQHQCFEVPASADPMFCEQLGDTRVKSDQALLSSPLPLSFVYTKAKHNATFRKYLNLVLFQLFCKWGIGK